MEQKGPFPGNSAEAARTARRLNRRAHHLGWLARSGAVRLARSGGVVLAEALVAQQFQPVRVSFAGQQLRRALAHPLGVPAAHEPPVVEEEAQQVQITPAY